MWILIFIYIYGINIKYLYKPYTDDIKTQLGKAEGETSAIKSTDPDRASGGAWGLLNAEMKTQSLESHKELLEDDAKISASLR